MGIQGLIPFMEKASRQVNVKQYAGCSVAVDAYCWLHKGAFSCAEKLARGEYTNAYVLYCMKFVNMLLAANVTPILVFDGRHLPAKAGTEKKRRESREVSRKRGAELLRAGRVDDARSFLRRCIDVTHEMALALMKECRRVGVDCIVAPYEADAQLAYLNMKGIAQLVITEDSDLVLFGCSRILFKMDLNGNGLLVEKERLFIAMRVRPELFCFEKFRHMCILSGCDYLASLPGIGLSKACKFVMKTAETNMHKALTKLPSYLNMNHLTVTQQYRDDFVRAVETFRYQLVFDPVSRKLVPLTDPPDSYQRDLSAGEMLPADVGFQLALGNLDPFTLCKVDNFDPDSYQVLSGKRQGQSIWSRNFKPKAQLPDKPDPTEVDRPTTRGKVVAVRLSLQAKKQEVPVDTSVSDGDLAAMYTHGEAAVGSSLKRVHQEMEGEAVATAEGVASEEPPYKQARRSCETSPPRSPIICGRVGRNPFAVKDVSRPDSRREPETSPSLLARLGTKCGALGKFSNSYDNSNSTKLVVCSRYFVPETESSSGSKETSNLGENITPLKVPESRNQHNSDSVLKDVSNKLDLDGNSSYKTKGNESPHKLSPMQNTEVDIGTAETDDDLSVVKLNTSSYPEIQPASENKLPSKSLSFKWGNFRKRYSFESNHSLQCSLSTSHAFKNPQKEESLSPPESLSQEATLSQGSDVVSDGSVTSADSGFLSDSPCTQFEKVSNLCVNVSKTETGRRPGLKKSTKQQSLLHLFGFQKKQKMAST